MDKGIEQILLGKYLKKMRVSQNLTQQAIALEAEISIRHYQSIEKGTLACRFTTLEKILKTYKTTNLKFFDDYLRDRFYVDGIKFVQQFFEPDTYRFITTDKDGLITSCSLDQAYSFTGYSTEEKIGKMNVWQLIHGPSNQAFVKQTLELLKFLRPDPFPWKTTLSGKSKTSIPVIAYWKYLYKHDQFDGFEIVVFKVT